MVFSDIRKCEAQCQDSSNQTLDFKTKPNRNPKPNTTSKKRNIKNQGFGRQKRYGSSKTRLPINNDSETRAFKYKQPLFQQKSKVTFSRTTCMTVLENYDCIFLLGIEQQEALHCTDNMYHTEGRSGEHPTYTK